MTLSFSTPHGEADNQPTDTLIFPCSSSQQRFWFMNLLSSGTTELNIALLWELRGRFNQDTIEAAFQAIVDRHEILRTRFIEKDGEPFQEVVDHYTFKLTVIDLAMIPEAKRLEEALALGRREAHVPFETDRLPLIRVTMVRLSQDHAILLVTLHHLVFDGWSIRLLAHEFGTIAAALDAHTSPDLPELPLQYGDFCLWQKEYLKSESFQEETEYWLKHLAGASYFEVRPDHERPARLSHKGEILSTFFPQELSDRMEETARAHNVTIFSLGCAVVAAMLHRYTGAADISFCTQIAGREEAELDNLIGLFINNLIMRFDADGDPTFEEFLARSNKTIQNALINQHVPFHKLVELLNPPRDPSRAPLVSVNFTVLRDVMEHQRYGAFELEGKPSLSTGALYDLNFFLVHWPNGWRMAVEYNPDLFEPSTIESMLAFLAETFQFVIAKPCERLSNLTPPLRAAAKSSLLADETITDLNEALLRHPDVGEAVVVPRVNAAGKAVANIYVVPALGSATPLETLPGKLSAYLAQELPSAERPNGISILLSLPRKADGMIDILALPIPSRVETAPTAPPSALHGPIEPRLAAIWEDILNVKNVGPDSNFFELGGHSLLAVRLSVRIAQTFGNKIDILTLFQAPTLRELARYLSIDEAPAEHWALVTIQEQGDKTPIIILNNTMRYYNLSRMIGMDRPMFGVQLDERTDRLPVVGRSIQEIAAEYIAPIRAAQPHGPYILGGLCVSGTIAYEVAHQLQQAGESVPLVIMLDNWVTPHLKYLPRFLYGIEYKIRLLLEDFKLWREGKTTIKSIFSGNSLLRKLFRLVPGTGRRPVDEVQRRIHESYMNFYPPLQRARCFYEPPFIDSHVVIMQSDEVANYFSDPLMGWEKYIQNQLDIYRVPGPHEEILYDEGARAMANYLRPILMNVDRQSNVS